MRVLYAGSGEIGIPTLQSLLSSKDHQCIGVLTQPDRPTGRGKVLQAGKIKQLAEASKIPVFQPEKASSEESVQPLMKLEAEVMIVFAYGQILKKNLLDLPPRGCFNLHASLLPRYRGASCLQAAILNGDEETGLTLMKMAEGLDTGDICLQSKLTISDQETAGSLHDRVAELGPDLLEKGLNQLTHGQLEMQPQEEALATYAPKLSKQDGLIDWQQSAGQISRHIRAMSPWPGAFSYIDDGRASSATRYVIHPPVYAQSGQDDQPCGLIMQQEENRFAVQTGEGLLQVSRLQKQGKKAMDVSDFMRGNDVLGKIFG
ncbi:MAG: methionyl-tRNA formyltransferase [Verrucomicrobiota bacterium]